MTSLVYFPNCRKYNTLLCIWNTHKYSYSGPELVIIRIYFKSALGLPIYLLHQPMTSTLTIPSVNLFLLLLTDDSFSLL